LPRRGRQVGLVLGLPYLGDQTADVVAAEVDGALAHKENPGVRDPERLVRPGRCAVPVILASVTLEDGGRREASMAHSEHPLETRTLVGGEADIRVVVETLQVGRCFPVELADALDLEHVERAQDEARRLLAGADQERAVLRGELQLDCGLDQGSIDLTRRVTPARDPDAEHGLDGNVVAQGGHALLNLE
jgi:hypothetical protein